MATVKKLIMEFTNESLGTYKFTIGDIKENITLSEVEDIANTIISENVFFTNGGDLKEFKYADIVTTTTERLA